MTAPCSRKDFLALSLGTLAITFVGCSDDGTASGDGSGGGGTGGSGGTSGGSGGTSGGSGGSTGGSAGKGGSGGSAGSGGGTGGSTGGSGGSGGSTGGSGGTSGGSGGGGAGGTSGGGSGGGGGAMCTGDITALCSKGDGAADGHVHLLVIPEADIMAGVTKTFETDDDTGHCHQVELTAEDFTTLKNGGVVKKVTCNGGNHEFVLSCGSSPPVPVNPSTCPGGDNEGMCG